MRRNGVACVEWSARGDRLTEWLLFCRVCKAEKQVETGGRDENAAARLLFEAAHAACIARWEAAKDR